ncbi:hypothetical protein SAY87_026287 [Trapa incisa]|uniref:Uncharacterized protein n=1 Tax=Trapa incisa TaxID=236973 RepID=A0AAN7JKK1_9MYRT|nr:hypothetical protein SAY87_026287 [Trapa incisa]
MIMERCIGAHRWHRIQRALRHGKVTVICLLLTVVVLRGTIGAGKFGTPEQDFVNIRDQIVHKIAEHRRVLEEIQPQQQQQAKTTSDSADSSGSSSTSNSNSYMEFDINAILKDEGPEEKSDPNKPYSIGPKISDWDEQPSLWLKANPQFPNFIGPEKPRVLGSSPKPCENPVGDHYLLKSVKNKIDYCRLHGIEIFYNMAL